MYLPTHWIDEALVELARHSDWSYRADGPTFTEPAALAATALLAHGRRAEAARPLEWLTRHQSSDGSLGVSVDERTPNWPTGLAVLAWLTADSIDEASAEGSAYEQQISRAVEWITATKSRAVKRSWEFGHDTTLIGWSWTDGTHGWVEPTAMQVTALKAAGLAGHPRTSAAVRLLLDRLCAEGGCNYGNTTVLGNELVPHLQPSGWALLALAGEADPSGRLAATVGYARRALTQTVSTASLCYALLGVTAHGQRPDDADARLEAAWIRTQRGGASAHKLALLLLAARADGGPLVTLPDREALSRSARAGLQAERAGIGTTGLRG